MKNTYIRLSGMVCLAASIATMGCGGIFDITYLIANKRYTESKEERKGTGQAQTMLEVTGPMAPDGTITPACYERKRQIERSFRIDRTYEYRGGYRRDVYISATILSAITGGAIAGLTAYLCQIPPSAQNNFSQPISCMNMLFAAPSAVDTVYSAIRIATAKKPKLVGKEKHENPVALGSTATEEISVPCDPSDKLVLGNVADRSNTELLEGRTHETPAFTDGGLPVQRTATGDIKLISQPEIVNAWITNPHWVLAMVNAAGEARTIHVDRCFALRSAVSVIQPQNITLFAQQCPASPQQPQMR
ncbi:MAG TPA: hypothetical protein PKA58_08020 [Polyangium sp.]|nr:hypothetical protein [Polyangium sp.]